MELWNLSRYATKIPPHNTHEVIKATIALIKNENLETKDIMKYIKGPDFPTGGHSRKMVFLMH